MKKCFDVLILFFCFILFFNFFSCKKEEKEEAVVVNNDTETKLKSLNEKVLLILGEDYYKKNNILECLEAYYNPSSIKSNVYILPYSLLMIKDFLRLKVISEKIDEIKPTTIISFGLPEKAGKYLLKALDENKDMVIISAFAMEEVPKLEAASDLIFDFELPDVLLNQEHDFSITDSELSLVLLSSFLSSESIREHGKDSGVLPIEDAKEAFKRAGEILEEKMGHNVYTLKPYVDSDIEMASYNYVLIYKSVIEDED